MAPKKEEREAYRIKIQPSKNENNINANKYKN